MEVETSYTSVYKDIWRELRRGQRHQIKDRRRPTWEDFKRVAEAFYQAEWCPHSERISFGVTRYRAEYNIWAYYCMYLTQSLGTWLTVLQLEKMESFLARILRPPCHDHGGLSIIRQAQTTELPPPHLKVHVATECLA